MSCDLLTFYHQKWSPESQSVHLALEASKIPHETVEVENLETNRVNDKLSNSLLVKNGKTSLKDYQEAAAFLHLLSEIPALRSKEETILKNFANYVLPFFEKAVVLKSPREGMDLFIEALSYLENELISVGNLYFGGQQPSVVDYGLFPYLDKIGKWTNELEPKDCPRIQTWINTMRGLPLVVETFKHNSNEEYLKKQYFDSVSQKRIDC